MPVDVSTASVNAAANADSRRTDIDLSPVGGRIMKPLFSWRAPSLPTCIAPEDSGEGGACKAELFPGGRRDATVP
jgi:hypothetical protein